MTKTEKRSPKTLEGYGSRSPTKSAIKMSAYPPLPIVYNEETKNSYSSAATFSSRSSTVKQTKATACIKKKSEIKRKCTPSLPARSSWFIVPADYLIRLTN